MGKVLFLENQVLFIVLLSEEFVFYIFTFGIFCCMPLKLKIMNLQVVLYGKFSSDFWIKRKEHVESWTPCLAFQMNVEMQSHIAFPICSKEEGFHLGKLSEGKMEQ